MLDQYLIPNSAQNPHWPSFSATFDNLAHEISLDYPYYEVEVCPAGVIRAMYLRESDGRLARSGGRCQKGRRICEGERLHACSQVWPKLSSSESRS